MSSSSSRLYWLDLLKGIAIYLVVLGHAVPVGSGLHNGIYAFHMPLFFFLAGYAAVMSIKPGAVSSFVKNRFVSVLIPYVVWLVVVPYMFASPGSLETIPFTSNLHQIVIGEKDWFLPALFCLHLLLASYAYLAGKTTRPWLKLLVLFGLFVGIFTLHRHFGRTTWDAPYWHLGWLTNAYVFFIPFFAGAFICRYKKMEVLLTENKVLMAILFLLFVFGIMYVSGNWGKAIFGTVASCMLVGVAKKMPTEGRVIAFIRYLGCHTLIIYLAHNAFFPPRLPRLWTDFLSLQPMVYLFAYGAVSLLSCLCCALLSQLLQSNKYVAFLFAGRRFR